ncbi:hypothetical protein [Desulfovibrio oxyclinae]|nr:hypothetical protein [Desulfovibrio oxyclinae]
MSNRPTLSSGDRKRFLKNAFKAFGSSSDRPSRRDGTPKTSGDG